MRPMPTGRTPTVRTSMSGTNARTTKSEPTP
jgi:hypothetical protein